MIKTMFTILSLLLAVDSFGACPGAWRQYSASGNAAYWKCDHETSWGAYVQYIGAPATYTPAMETSVHELLSTDDFEVGRVTVMSGPVISVYFQDASSFPFQDTNIVGYQQRFAESEIADDGALLPAGAGCLIRLEAFDDGTTTRPELVAHEMGHALNLGHVPGPDFMGETTAARTMVGTFSRVWLTCQYSRANKEGDACTSGSDGPSWLSAVDYHYGSVMDTVHVVFDGISDYTSCAFGVVEDGEFTAYDSAMRTVGGEWLVVPKLTDDTMYYIEAYLDTMLDGAWNEWHSPVGGGAISSRPGQTEIFQSLQNSISDPYWSLAFAGEVSLPDITEYDKSCKHLIVVPEGYYAGAAALASHWIGQGIDTEVAVVYSGTDSVDIINNAIHDGVNNGNLESVLIVGRAFSGNNMPMNIAESTFHFYTLDSFYGDSDGDTVIDIPVGRLPISQASELQWYAYKVIDYYGDLSDVGLLPVDYSSVSLVSVVQTNNLGELDENGQLLTYQHSSILGDIADLAPRFHILSWISNDDPYWYVGNEDIGAYKQSCANALVSYLRPGYLRIHNHEHNGYRFLGAVVPNVDWWKQNEGMPQCYYVNINMQCYGGLPESSTSSQTMADYEVTEGYALASVGSYEYARTGYHLDVTREIVRQMFAELSMPIPERLNIGEIWKRSSNAAAQLSQLYRGQTFKGGIVGDPRIEIFNVEPSSNTAVEPGDHNIVYAKPNPSSGIIHIVVPDKASVESVAIYDLRGRVVSRIDKAMLSKQAQGESIVLLDKGLSSGVYYYRVKYAGRSTTGKFTILR